MTTVTAATWLDIPPGPPPTQEEPVQPAPEPTVAQPSTSPVAAPSWSGGDIAIALVAVLALVAAVVALSIFVARRPA